MKNNNTKNFLTLLVLITVPAFFLIINWQWDVTQLNNSDYYLLLITDTAGMPYAILTSFCLIVLLCFLVKNNNCKMMVKVIIICILTQGLGQIIKSTIKTFTAEPRPFVIWMQDKNIITTDSFYKLSKKERKKTINQHLDSKKSTDKQIILPNWLVSHWQNETGYSFPSGHSLFVTSWVFLFIMLLSFKKRKFVLISIIIWAVFVEYSRLKLGMHTSIDVLVSVLISFLLVNVITKIFKILQSK